MKFKMSGIIFYSLICLHGIQGDNLFIPCITIQTNTELSDILYWHGEKKKKKNTYYKISINNLKIFIDS
jgi:hypothetical protein